jgi:CRISPR-associated protein Cmr3
MRYLITLTPLEPYLFGGDNTFGKLQTDDEKKKEGVLGTYLVHSRQFPQQSALLGMIRKEIMTQSGTLTRKVRGEWVDPQKKNEALSLVGADKFDIFSSQVQNFGTIKSLEPVFLIQNEDTYIKKVDIDSFSYSEGLLKDYNPKVDIYDNFINVKTNKKLSSDDIFKEVEKTANKKGGEENSLFKKTSYILKDGFKFGFYLECDYKLENSIVTLGADRSSFKLEVKETSNKLDYEDKNAYLTLLSDAYITIALKGNCEFAITSAISYQNLQNKKHAIKHNEFQKSTKVFLYEKGSVIISPSKNLLDNLNNKNLQKIGYNKFTIKGQN